MGIREDFDDLLSQWGYPILIVRQSKKMRCSCWNEKRQEADRDCPVCFGLGFTPIVEKHTGRGEDVSSPDTFPLIQKEITMVVCLYLEDNTFSDITAIYLKET